MYPQLWGLYAGGLNVWLDTKGDFGSLLDISLLRCIILPIISELTNLSSDLPIYLGPHPSPNSFNDGS